ncbi:hypothetical protein COOONC_03934, partial [Cooperia oncophora]
HKSLSIQPSITIYLYSFSVSERQRTKPAKPVIDLEPDIPIRSEHAVTESPAAKKRKEQKEEGEVTDDSSESMSVIYVDDDVSSAEATKASSPVSVSRQVIDLTVDEETTKQINQPTLRDVLSSLVSQHDDLEDGEIEEEECVVDLTEGLLSREVSIER